MSAHNPLHLALRTNRLAAVGPRKNQITVLSCVFSPLTDIKCSGKRPPNVTPLINLYSVCVCGHGGGGWMNGFNDDIYCINSKYTYAWSVKNMIQGRNHYFVIIV